MLFLLLMQILNVAFVLPELLRQITNHTIGLAFFDWFSVFYTNGVSKMFSFKYKIEWMKNRKHMMAKCIRR